MDDRAPLRAEDFAPYLPWLERLARQLVRDPGVAEDLTQETWLVAVSSGAPRAEGVRGWLAGVLRHRALRHTRSEARRRHRERAAARVEALPPDTTLERAESARQLVNLLLEQPEPYRTTLIERFFEGRSPSAIARKLGLPPATVRSHLRRGLARMRVSLEADARSRGEDLIRALAPLVAGKGARRAGVVLAKSWLESQVVQLGLVVALVLGIAWVVRDTRGPAPGAPPVAIEVLDESSEALFESGSGPATEEREREPLAVFERQNGGVTGRVLAATGAAARGALVYWALPELGARIPFPLDSKRKRPRASAPEVHEVEVCEDGTFSIPHPGVGPLRIAARAPGHAPYDDDGFLIPSLAPLRLPDITLMAEAVLVGRVVDENGAGVAGVQLDLEFESDSGFLGSPAFAYVLLGTSRDDGGFSLGGLSVGPFTLRATSEHHAPTFAIGAIMNPVVPSEVLVELSPSRTISGRVHMPGEEAFDDIIVAFTWAKDQRQPPDMRDEHMRGHVPCDPDGRFVVPVRSAAEASRYALVPCRMANWQQHHLAEPREVRAGDQEVVLEARAACELVFELYDGETGAALDEPDVRYVLPFNNQVDANDRGQLMRLGPGRYAVGSIDLLSETEQSLQLRIGRAGYRELVLSGLHPQPGQRTDLGRLVMESAAGIDVVVRDVEGNPVVGATVVREAPDAPSLSDIARRGPLVSRDPRLIEAEVDAGGRAWVPLAEGVTNYLHARAPGFALRAPLDLAPGELPSEPLELELSEGAALVITVRGTDDEPLAGIRVRLEMPDPTRNVVGVRARSFHEDAYTDMEGRAAFGNLPAGEAVVAAVYGEEQSVVLPSAGDVELTLRCTPQARANGTVSWDGGPLIGARLKLIEETAQGTLEVGKTYTDGRGAFRFPLASIGPLLLTLEHPHHPIPVRRRLQLDKDEEPWEVQVESAALAGRVVDDSGKARASSILTVAASVDAEKIARFLARESGYAAAVAAAGQAGGVGRNLVRDRGDILKATVSQRADGSGGFRFNDLPTGQELALIAVDRNSEPAVRILTLEDGELREDLELALLEAGALQVEVDLVGSGSETRFGLDLRVQSLVTPPPFVALHHGRLDAQGRARFERLAPGRWRVSLSASPTVVTVREIDVQAGGTTRAQLADPR